MTEIIPPIYEASDISVLVTPQGEAVLTVIGADGRAAIHTTRQVLEQLASKIKHALEHVDALGHPR